MVNVLPEMMSEEEDGAGYIRHPPSYCSDALNAFIVKLDTGLQSKCTKHRRLERTLGYPREKPDPSQCKKWMVWSTPLPNDEQENELSTLQKISFNASDSEVNSFGVVNVTKINDICCN